MRRKRSSKIKFHNKALTLIEILVVMAIILMLAGITYKVVMRAIKKAEEVEDVSDTRQGNIEEFIGVVESGGGYDALPKHLKEGKFGESGTE
jgi:prepilin-type N-terminal cleavage/methylation domain-containing protein